MSGGLFCISGFDRSVKHAACPRYPADTGMVCATGRVVAACNYKARGGYNVYKNYRYYKKHLTASMWFVYSQHTIVKKLAGFVIPARCAAKV
jgi:hypothetical protein